MPPVQPLDPRVAELLSALLDGAVTAEEREAAELWLERSEAARAEYRSLHQIKATLGGLGEIDPPFGFYERLLSPSAARRRRWSLPAVAASVAASAAGFVVFGGAAAPDQLVTPAVDEVAAGDADGAIARDAIRGQVGAGVHVLRQEADGVDWDGLPRGERLDRGGYQIWRDLTTDDGEERVVVHRDGVVVTVAGDGVDVDELIDVGRDVVRDEPAADGDDGLADRIRDACENLLRSLSLG